MSSLKVLISDHDANAADPILTLQLLQSASLIEDDESADCSPEYHPVQRSWSQMNALHRQYAAINEGCILPAFPSNTNGIIGRLERYYAKLFIWAPEIENWDGLHEFFSDRTPLIKHASKSPGILRFMLQSLVHKRSARAPALPAHYASKEQVELKHDTLTVYKRITQHEYDLKQLQGALTSELVALCQQGKLVEELGGKLEDLATIKICGAGNSFSKDKDATSITGDTPTGHDGLFTEEMALRSHAAFESFCGRTVRMLGQMELAEQSFIKHVSEHVIEPIRDHMHDFENAKLFLDKRTAALMSVDKAGDAKRGAESRLRQLEMNAAQGNASAINEAEARNLTLATKHFHDADALVHDQLALFLERSKAIIDDLLGVYEKSRKELRTAVRARLSQT